MESPVSTPAVLPLHLLVPVVNNDISSPCEQIMVRTRSVGVNTCDVALATEPECLGPCEPGTSVNLEGIVWQETEDGKCCLNWFSLFPSWIDCAFIVIPLPSQGGGCKVCITFLSLALYVSTSLLGIGGLGGIVQDIS